MNEDGELQPKLIRTTERGPGSSWVKEIYALFAPARQEASRCGEAEVNAAIDEAVKAVRAGYEARRP